MDYKDLDVWKESRKLTKMIYELTQSFPDVEKFGLVSQMRRAAVSVPPNIAEGSGRNSNKVTIQFLGISKGSLFELETQLLLSLDLGFTSQQQFEEVNTQLVSCKKLTDGLLKFLKTTLAK